MIRKRLIGVWLVAGFLIFAAGVFWLWRSDVNSSLVSYQSDKLNPSIFSVTDFFTEYENPSVDICSHDMLGGITTHHQQASPLIGQFFKCLAVSTYPKTVVLIGPNHYHRGSRGVVLASQAWDTPFGILEPDIEAITQLAESDLVEINDNAVSQDHAVGLLIPYLSYYFPEAKVVPMLINYSVNEAQTEKFQQFINRVLDEHTIVVGSIDFSHYLTSAESNVMDGETNEIVRNYKLDEIYKNGDEHYDSAPGLYIILSLMKQKNARTETIAHSDTSEFNGVSSYVTSYFNWVFL
ncbi:AmmeMemoRadiSam system protein B [Patescibacteria group bacterium]|nr:AmmeMemoRadiSam system protein B [Patescibacteria group bacterium]MBU1890606.1 AmmeMemoRadiSam system protein B [Patescibacteria group bacterium]